MNRPLARFLAPLVTLLGLSLAQAAPLGKLRVLATIPDLADISRQIGGERVEVSSIADGRENIHFVAVRPSDLVAVERTEVFVEVGLSLEHAWVPGLLLAARNDRIQPGTPNFIQVSQGWPELLQVPVSMSREQAADLHPQGNPHINLDPRAGRHFARVIHAGLRTIDPADAAGYDQRLARYEARLDEAEARWARWAERLRGQRVVLYHADLNYFCAANGLQIVGTLEPKPGLAPTPGHLATLIARMKQEGAHVVLAAAWANNRNARKVAEQTGAVVLEIPVMVGGVEGADTWIEMMDWLHENVGAALGVEAPPDAR